MASENLKIDVNNKSVAGAITDDANQFIKMLRIDDTTKALKVSLAGGSIPIVAGSDTWVQYNKTGALGADANFRFDYTNQVLMIGNGTPTYTVGTNNILSVTKSVAGYLAVDIQNLSAGTTSSSDLIIANDAATDTTNFLDIGIASYTNTDPLYTIGGAGDAYIWNQSNNLAVGTATAGKVLKLFTGGTLAANEGARLDGGLFSVGLLNTTLGKLKLYGNTSGSVTIQPNAIAGSGIVLTAPATTGTIALTSQITSGTVTSVSVTTANGVSGTVATATTTPAISISLGAITPTSVNGLTITANGTNTLNITAGKTLAVTNTLTLSGTDSTVMTFPTTSATIARTDAAQSFTGVQTFVAPILGTPTSVSLTNATGLPAASIVAGIIGVTDTRMTKIWTTDIESTNAPTVGGVVVPTISSTSTFTNKRTNPRLVTAASYTTDTGTSLDISTCDEFVITAQAGALKFNNPSGTPVQGNKLIIRIKDNGTARALTYDTQFRAIGVTLPTTTVLSKTLYMGFIYNSDDTKWDCVATAQEA